MSGMRIERGGGLGAVDAYLTVELERGDLALRSYHWPDTAEPWALDIVFHGPRGGYHGSIRFDPEQAHNLRNALLNVAHWSGGRALCPGSLGERIRIRKRDGMPWTRTLLGLYGPKSRRYALAVTDYELTDIAAAIRFCSEEVAS